MRTILLIIALTCMNINAMTQNLRPAGSVLTDDTCDSRITLVPGGVPLVVDGKVVGAIGIGGGTREQDLEIAACVIARFAELAR